LAAALRGKQRFTCEALGKLPVGAGLLSKPTALQRRKSSNEIFDAYMQSSIFRKLNGLFHAEFQD
jgi:hypothetical protein